MKRLTAEEKTKVVANCDRLCIVERDMTLTLFRYSREKQYEAGLNGTLVAG